MDREAFMKSWFFKRVPTLSVEIFVVLWYHVPES